MAKEYKYSTGFRNVLLVLMLVGIYGGIELGRQYGYVMTFIGIAAFVYFVLLFLRYKIVTTEEYIVADLGKLGKRFERKWEKINRVSRISIGFYWIYKIQCANEPPLMFTSFITNYKGLLREIVEKSKNAVVDDSIRKLLERK